MAKMFLTLLLTMACSDSEPASEPADQPIPAVEDPDATYEFIIDLGANGGSITGYALRNCVIVDDPEAASCPDCQLVLRFDCEPIDIELLNTPPNGPSEAVAEHVFIRDYSIGWSESGLHGRVDDGFGPMENFFPFEHAGHFLDPFGQTEVRVNSEEQLQLVWANQEPPMPGQMELVLTMLLD